MSQAGKDGSGYLDSPIYNFVRVKPLDFQGKNFFLYSNDNPTHLQDSVRKSFNNFQQQTSKHNDKEKVAE